MQKHGIAWGTRQEVGWKEADEESTASSARGFEAYLACFERKSVKFYWCWFQVVLTCKHHGE